MKGVKRENGKIVIVDGEKKEFADLIQTLSKQARDRLIQLNEKQR